MVDSWKKKIIIPKVSHLQLALKSWLFNTPVSQCAEQSEGSMWQTEPRHEWMNGPMECCIVFILTYSRPYTIPKTHPQLYGGNMVLCNTKRILYWLISCDKMCNITYFCNTGGVPVLFIFLFLFFLSWTIARVCQEHWRLPCNVSLMD